MATTYSTDIAGTVRSKLETAMNNLKSAMGALYGPIFTYVYDHHSVARLRLNGVSVDIDSVDAQEIVDGTRGAILVPLMLTASIRVHLAYTDGYLDAIDCIRLLQSTDNWLHTHNNLGDGYYIDNTNMPRSRAEFEESQTLGGELIVMIAKHEGYTQL